MKPIHISEIHESHDTGAEKPASSGKVSEHLANERTYLAYMRTSVSLISFGITLNRFALYLVQSQKVPERALAHWNLNELGRVGLGMVIFGLVLMLWAGIHYSIVLRSIDLGRYHGGHKAIWIITAGVLVSGALSLIWLFPR